MEGRYRGEKINNGQIKLQENGCDELRTNARATTVGHSHRSASWVAVKRTLIASMAYSTWNNRPSGEKVLTPRSYSERVRIINVN